MEGPLDRRRARHDGGGRGGGVQSRPPDPRQNGDAGRGGLGLCQGRAAGHDPIRRRSATRQTRQELSRRSTGQTLYILDEPTTGLHFEDVRKLLEVLHRLVEQGNSVVVIEHNLDVIKTADWIIDLGPEGGVKGGEIVAEGTPEDVVKVAASYTGHYLKPMLAKAN